MLKKTIILGTGAKAAHVFYTCYRSRAEFRVIAFLSTALLENEQEIYPPEIAGPLYPQGIPVLSHTHLCALARREEANEIVFAGCDTTFEYLSQLEQTVVFTARTEFQFAQVERCLLPCHKPSIAVCGTGSRCGKTQLTRQIAQTVRSLGSTRVAVGKYPEGELLQHTLSCFTLPAELTPVPTSRQQEYAAHLAAGERVYSGVDWRAIWDQAMGKADVLLWDGGANDIAFVAPDLYVTVVDCHTPNNVIAYPGYLNVELADVLVLYQSSGVTDVELEAIVANLHRINMQAAIWDWHDLTVSDSEAAQQMRQRIISALDL
jgi:predicted GTPase